MNRLSTERRNQVVNALIEGVGVNAKSRLTGVGKQAILRLLNDLGTVCANFHHEKMRGTKPTRVECDAVWSFAYAKEKSLRPEYRGKYGMGDVWLWTAIDKDSRPIIAYWIGQRTPVYARSSVQNRIAHDAINRCPSTGHASIFVQETLGVVCRASQHSVSWFR